ncbi:MAG: DNA alkylation repair protein [Chloroflexi bacterium]|nr:DNA alkylation repair protein [Chloroflexota bacterium]
MAGLSAENKLRDIFNPRVITSFAGGIGKVWPPFDQKGFVSAIVPKLNDLGFGERSTLIRDTLAEFLPQEFPKAVGIVVEALGPALQETKMPLDAFIVSPQCAFVSKYGKDHFEISMKALYEMTKRFSAEFDLRTFIEVDYERAMNILHEWCTDPNPHVRRLVSEGTRPRLPLAGRIKRFQKDPRPVIALLDKLKDDESEYVRRSVANNINDIAKDNPDIAIAALKQWSREADSRVMWVVRHAARSLIKQGHQEAIAMLGYTTAPKIKVSGLTISPHKVERGGQIVLSFSCSSRSSHVQKLVVDYAIYYHKANGRLVPKVFKLRDLTLSPKGNIRIERKITLRDTSGRTIYPGPHEIEVRINGEAYGNVAFAVRHGVRS